MRSIKISKNAINKGKKMKKAKLSKEELYCVRSALGGQREKQLQDVKQVHIEQIRKAVDSGAFMKPNGKINKSKLADYLRIDRQTVFNLLPLLVGCNMKMEKTDLLTRWVR